MGHAVAGIYFCRRIPRVILLVFLVVSTKADDEMYCKFNLLC